MTTNETTGRDCESRSRSEAEGNTQSTTHSGVGPVAFLARRVARQLVTLRHLHRDLGVVLDVAETSAVEDLPRLHIKRMATDEQADKALHLTRRMQAAAKEIVDSLAGAHTESSLAFYAEMELEREEKRRGMTV